MEPLEPNLSILYANEFVRKLEHTLASLMFLKIYPGHNPSDATTKETYEKE
jgi:hypothetical protein